MMIFLGRREIIKFGFKPKVGSSTAMYTLRSIVNYFTSNGSTLTVCALDITKAFREIDYYALCIKLILCNVPICFINLIMTGYGSDVLSPTLFAIYMDDLINR